MKVTRSNEDLSVSRDSSADKQARNTERSQKSEEQLSRKQQRLQQKRAKSKCLSTSPPRTASWCRLTIDFSECNSLDPESVDSSFPPFDVYFVPVFKESVANWIKPFVEILKINRRVSYAQFERQTHFKEWMHKKTLPANVAVFQCEHQATHNKTRVNNFVAVNKLLADQGQIGYTEFRSEYRMYFVPSSSGISHKFNKQYQSQIEVAHDRMWVVWVKKS